jgi:hypothetical protein
MALRSYLRTSIGAADKGVGALRPSRMPVWGLSRPSMGFYDSASGPRKTGAADTGRHVNFDTKPAEPIVQSSQEPAHSRYKATIGPKPDFRLATQALPGQPLTSIQDLSHGRQDESTERARPAGMTPAISGAKESQAPHSSASTPRREGEAANPGRDIAALRARRTDHRQSTQTRVDQDHHVDSLFQGLSPNEMPQSLTANAESPRLQPQRPILELPKLAETQVAAHQYVSNLREAMAVFRGFAQSSASSKQADNKPSGNAIQIGSIDIHIHAAPSPVRPVVRQVVQAATPIAPIARGFAASFGLRQA